MPPANVDISVSAPGTYFLEDDGIPGNNTSQLRHPDGSITPFEHPIANLNFLALAPGITLVIDFVDILGGANFTVGSLTNPAWSPDTIIVNNVHSSNAINTYTLVANGAIVESADADAAPDISVVSLVMSAGTGIGTSANALETSGFSFEARTNTGGINLVNFGDSSLGGSTDIDGLEVVTSGDINFTSYGSIDLFESGGASVNGGATSGNVTLIANGGDADIRAQANSASIFAPRGDIVLTAGRDVLFGTAGDFNNDVLANGNLVISAGRDLIVDGQADLESDDFGLGTGGDVVVEVGRNIGILDTTGNGAGIAARGVAGGSVFLTTGTLGTLTLNAPVADAVRSSSGNVTVNADRMVISPSSGISLISGGVATVNVATPGRAIDLGTAADSTSALGLSDAELDRIFVNPGTLIIGGNNAGPVTISASIAPGGVGDLIIRSGTNINVNADVATASALSLRALDNVFQTSASTIATGTMTVFVDSVDDDPNVGGIATLGGTTIATTVVNGNLDADTLNGNAAGNILFGFEGNDRLDGNGGDDFLVGGAGADKLIGDGGIDTVDYSGNFGAVSVNLTTNLGQFNFAQGDVYSEIENANGTEFNDILTGSAVVNVLNGNGGDDVIKGNAGADIMNGGAGIDTADYSGNFGAVSIDLQAGTGQFNFAQGDVLTGFENATGTEFGDTLTGTAAANVLVGNGGNDKLTGANGDDQLIGGAGNDNLIGGLGADLLDGGANVDTANYSGNFGAVSVNLFTGVGDMNFAEGDTYIGIDKVIGTDFNDIMESNGVTNIFTGGLGNDTFIFRPGFSQDIVTDFAGNGAAAGDTIRFRTGVFTDFADMLANAFQQGSDVVIQDDASNFLVLQNVLLGDLHSSDFIFG